MIKKEGFKRELDPNCMGWTVGQENQQKRQGETRAKWEILQIKHIKQDKFEKSRDIIIFLQQKRHGRSESCWFFIL